ncbi:MAG: site-specific integrase, partial [Pseudolabrys sp.]|nr:site-specific integrase [Pseudolabrys sp.]
MARANKSAAKQAAGHSADVALFLDMLAAERGATANTIDAYTRDLGALETYLSAQGRTLHDATTDDLRSYLSSLADEGFKATSVARRLSALRQLFRFMYAEQRRADDPAAVLEGPKRARTLPKVLSMSDVDRMLAAARDAMSDTSQPAGQRLRAARLLCLLETVYATGLRVSELVALPASAARRDQAMLVIRGKGGKERLVPLNDAAKRAMKDYLKLSDEAGRKDAADSKWLFPSFGESGHLTRQRFARELKALAAAAGL